MRLVFVGYQRVQGPNHTGIDVDINLDINMDVYVHIYIYIYSYTYIEVLGPRYYTYTPIPIPFPRPFPTSIPIMVFGTCYHDIWGLGEDRCFLRDAVVSRIRSCSLYMANQSKTSSEELTPLCPTATDLAASIHWGGVSFLWVFLN